MSKVSIEALKKDIEVEGFLFRLNTPKSDLSGEDYSKLKNSKSYKALIKKGFIRELSDNEVTKNIAVEEKEAESNGKVSKIKDRHKKEISELEKKYSEALHRAEKERQEQVTSLRNEFGSMKGQVKDLQEKLELEKKSHSETKKNLHTKVNSLEKELSSLKKKNS